MARGKTGALQRLATETCIVSLAYLSAFFATFEILMPLQNLFFAKSAHSASLLFLPHGVRVLTAWLLGWRAPLVLLPGVSFVFFYVAGWGALTPSRLAAIAIAVCIPTLCFQLLRLLGHDLRPAPGKPPCWPCIMAVGLMIAIATSLLTNYAFGSPPMDYAAYLIGDIGGLFFLMLILMVIFRRLRSYGL
ncbi:MULTISPECIES: hypothetical protein [Pseudophaeobacter]|uniref:hypothetical protein n=1 Tax=Pseudophaeobacter TaxID=1541822 RepID=UPI00242BE500|nr:hypothetical protein [Pseudophaeobacter profundi]